MVDYLFKYHLKETLIHAVYIIWGILVVLYNKHLNNNYLVYETIFEQAIYVMQNEGFLFLFVAITSISLIAYYAYTIIRDIKYWINNFTETYYRQIDWIQIAIRIFLTILLLVLINNPILRILLRIVFACAMIIGFIANI